MNSIEQNSAATMAEESDSESFESLEETLEPTLL